LVNARAVCSEERYRLRPASEREMLAECKVGEICDEIKWASVCGIELGTFDGDGTGEIWARPVDKFCFPTDEWMQLFGKQRWHTDCRRAARSPFGLGSTMECQGNGKVRVLWEDVQFFESS
jgi:hypothetical protein